MLLLDFSSLIMSLNEKRNVKSIRANCQMDEKKDSQHYPHPKALKELEKNN